MATLLLVVAAPSAMAGGGGSANPIAIMRDVADATYRLTGLMVQSNASLTNIDAHTKELLVVEENLKHIGASTEGMAAKTTKINETLASVGSIVGSQRRQLGAVDEKLAKTASSMGGVKRDVSGSLAATRAVSSSFQTIDVAIGTMDAHLKASIGQMATSAPLTKAFAENRTRVSLAGGDTKKYGVPNFAPNARVMSIVLPMIDTMQQGGMLPARKDRHRASNPIVGIALGRSVPDGTNVQAKVLPFDGRYGLPGPDFFVNTPINGF